MAKAERARRAAPKRPSAKRPAPRTTSKRADFAAPVDAFFARQPPELRAILDALRAIIEQAAPDAESSLKWGMPWFSLGGKMMCSLTAHRAHVNLVLVGPARAFEDPEQRLAGSSPNGRHLKLTALDELPRAAVRRWLRTAAKLARAKT